jgi:hypothetical protein
MKLNLVGPSNTAYSLAVSAQQSLNCYLESIEGGDGKGKFVLRGRPGMVLFKDLTTIDAAATPMRGMWSGGGRLFVAAGTKEFEVSSAGALVGSVNTIYDDGTHSPVTILPNSNQLLIVASGKVYCDNGTGPVQITFAALSGQCTTINKLVLRELTPNGSTGNTDSFDVGMVGQTITINGVGYTVDKVTNPDMLQLTGSAGLQSFHDWSCTPILQAPTAAFLDSYYLVPRTSSRQYNISGLLDGTSWAGLDFALKEGWPDNLASIWSEPPLCYLLGTETLEIVRNTGNASFPFERLDGGFARVGLASTFSPVSIMGKLHMLAGGTYGQTVAVRMEGATPVQISTHAVEEALKSKAFPGQGVSFSYIERGHWFWVIGFTGGNSWVYDFTESEKVGSPQWHERAGWSGSANTQYVPWFHTFIPEWGTAGKHIVGDGATGKLYEMSSDIFDDDGSNIRYVRTLPYVYADNKRVYHHRLDLEIESGTTATRPTVTLDWSDDRGQTWGTGSGGVGSSITMDQAAPGSSGVYTTRFYAVALGHSRGRVYRLTILSKGKVAVIDAVLDADVGMS